MKKYKASLFEALRAALRDQRGNVAAPVAVMPASMMPGGGGGDPLNMAAYATMNVASPEDIWQPVYDRANYAAAGAASVAFFTIALGGSATLITPSAVTFGTGAAASKVKTFRDTNLQQPGVIPTKDYLVVGLSLTFIPANTTNVNATSATPESTFADVATLAYGGFLTFQLIDKPYLIVPNNFIPGIGPGAAAFASTTTTGNTMALVPGSGLGGPQNLFWFFELPLLIRAYQTFFATLTFDGAPILSQTFDIQLAMWGYMRRPSQ